MPKFHLVLLIHGHQPVGNFDSIFEQVYQVSYLPFLDCLARHPGVRMGLHYTGPLLEWLDRSHPEFLARLKEMSERGQVEIIGGGYYEPILVTLPPWDQAEQVERMRRYIAEKFGKEPAGAWLAERVWEPSVPSALASAGVGYTLVDDIHFIGAGFENEQLFGDYVCEDGGKTIRVFPGLKALRYLFPFASVEQGIQFLRESAARHPGGMASMGDDCEKFGAWPGTFDLCYRDGWLDRLLSALEANSDWLETCTPAGYLASHKPLGRADLPTASYTEMMEWMLPTSARFAFQAVEHEFAARPEVMRFVRGGPWRGFFTKYPESNLLHKKMLRTSHRVQALAGSQLSGERSSQLATARTHVLRAQCNDAYWHGIFGGLYAPHLRTVLLSELIRADALIARIDSRGGGLTAEKIDYDADGAEEILVESARIAALLRPADGGTLAAYDFRPRAVTLVNSIQRRPETYHSKLRNMSAAAAGDGGGVVSIHNQMRVKEPGLEQLLRYDRWPRNAFRLLAFPAGKTLDDYRQVQLEEQPALAAGEYVVREAGSSGVTLTCAVPAATGESSEGLVCTKKFQFSEEGSGARIDCSVEITAAQAPESPLRLGLELIVNLLAPDEPTRYIETGTTRHPLRWGGTVQVSELPGGLRIIDEWQGVAVTIRAPAAAEFWILPIETVSESEDGFERVYQGSQFLVLWPGQLAAGDSWRGQVSLHIEAIAGEGVIEGAP